MDVGVHSFRLRVSGGIRRHLVLEAEAMRQGGHDGHRVGPPQTFVHLRGELGGQFAAPQQFGHAALEAVRRGLWLSAREQRQRGPEFDGEQPCGFHGQHHSHGHGIGAAGQRQVPPTPEGALQVRPDVDDHDAAATLPGGGSPSETSHSALQTQSAFGRLFRFGSNSAERKRSGFDVVSATLQARPGDPFADGRGSAAEPQRGFGGESATSRSRFRIGTRGEQIHLAQHRGERGRESGRKRFAGGEETRQIALKLRLSEGQ